MYKKLIMSCMAVAAFAAFVLPATASATNDPQLTDAAGTVAVGSKILGTNVGETYFYNTATTIKLSICNKVRMTGEVTANSGGTVKGKVTTADFSGTGAISADNGLNECTGEIGSSYVTVKNLPLELSSTPTMATDEFQVTGSAGAKVKFLLGSTTAGECEYEATGPIKGDYTTGTSAAADAKLTTRDTESGSGAKLIRGGFLCPTSGVLAMTFTLETDTLPNETADPIWIS
jgi:hypothetical protein